MAFEFRVGSISAEINLENDQFLKALKQSIDETKKASGEIQSNLSKVRATLADAIKATGVAALKGSFAALGTVAGTVLSKIQQGIVALLNPFRTLQSIVFNVRNLLIGFGVIKLIQRGNEVEALRFAFDNLSRSIGQVSGVFIDKLRVALRGTVSDFEIMRITNNAILLGAAKTGDQFAELAEAARRLGRAVGRDPVSALEDLSLGIGRQSRLLLDNLGIIVKVGEAYSSFARTLGKDVTELTDAEQRTAFLGAATEAVRKRLAALGPDIELNIDAWARLGATISNLFSDISRALIGAGIPNALDAILSENRIRIVAFVKLVDRVVTDLVQKVVATVRRLAAGDESIGNIGAEIIDAIIATLTAGLSAIFRTIVSVVGNLAPPVTVFLIAIVKEVMDAVFTEITNRFQKETAALRQTILSAKIFGKSLIPQLLPSKDEFHDLQLALDVLEAFGPAAEKSQKEIADAVRKQIESSTAEIDNGAAAVVEGAKNTAEDVRNIISREFDKLSGRGSAVIDSVFTSVRERMNQFRAESIASIAELGGLQVSESLQPVANVFNSMTESAARFAVKIVEIGNTLTNIFGGRIRGLLDKPVDFITDRTISLMESFLRSGRSIIAFLNNFTFAAQKAEQAKIIDSDTVLEQIEPFRQELKRLEEGINELDLSEGEQAVRKFLDAITKIRGELTPEAIGIVDRFFLRLQNAANKFDATKKLEEFRREFKATLQDLERETEKARLQAESVGLTPLKARLAEIDADINRRIKDLPSEPSAEQRLRLELEAAKIKQFAILEQSRRDVQELGVSLSQSVLGGLAEAFARGEKLSKAWSQITANLFQNFMNKAINDISNTLGSALSTVLGKITSALGAGPGAGSALAGIASAAIGIGAAILSNLENKKTSSVEDFDRSITSSEAIRGVVAGPSNVAISKVGESLKQALTTTEILLEQILAEVRRGGSSGGGGGVPGGARNPRNAVLPLTGSTV